MPRLLKKHNAWGAAIAALTISVFARPAAADIIYDNNFEDNTNGFSASFVNPGFTPYIRVGNTMPTTILPTTPGGFLSTPNSTFLGLSKGPAPSALQFGFTGKTTVTLTLGGLTPGKQYLLGFDLFIGKGVEGNATVPSNAGPDRFTVKTTANTLVDTTFNTYGPEDKTDGRDYAKFGQAYSDNDLTGFGNPASKYAPFTGADVVYNDPSTNPLLNYSIYYFGRYRNNAPSLVFTATGSTDTIQWISNFTTSSVNNEIWAIDNIQVADLPEPSTLGMMLLTCSGCFRSLPNAPQVSRLTQKTNKNNCRTAKTLAGDCFFAPLRYNLKAKTTATHPYFGRRAAFFMSDDLGSSPKANCL